MVPRLHQLESPGARIGPPAQTKRVPACAETLCFTLEGKTYEAGEAAGDGASEAMLEAMSEEVADMSDAMDEPMSLAVAAIAEVSVAAGALVSAVFEWQPARANTAAAAEKTTRVRFII